MKTSWENILDSLNGKLSAQVFDAWIRPISFVKLEEKGLFLEVPDSFFKEWLETHYLNTIKAAADDVIEGGISLHVAVKNRSYEKQSRLQCKPLSAPSLLTSSNIRERYTFDGFVVGACNQFAHAACFAVANNPADNYNPLFLFGGVGLGKTHLLNAIGYHILKKNICTKVCYTTSEQFTNELINSIRYEKMSSFRERFRNLEVLLIDDIQFLAGKERTQEEFFHTFNSLYESHQQIIITSDTPPKDIHFLEERLRSRFEWGLIADIQPPETETRVAILKQKALAENISLPNDVAFFLASNVKSNIRELEGLLTRVVAFSSLNHCEISLDLAQEVLKNLIKIKEKEFNVSTIQKIVANYFNIKSSDLKSSRKHKGVVLPRQICMYLTRKLTPLSFPEIGAHFGGKDHSTIIYAVKKIEKELKSNQQVKKHVNLLIKRLEE